MSGAGLTDRISKDKNHMLKHQQFSQAYENLQAFYKSLDWYRVVKLAVDLLKMYPDVARQTCDSFEHVLVDEYQDLNPKDQELILLLSEQCPTGLCVVGDEDQSIYESQRFAAPLGLVNLDQRVPGLQTLSLTICHRCSVEVLEKANLVIINNAVRITGKPALQCSDPTKHGIVHTFVHKSKKREKAWVVRKVIEMNQKGIPYKEIMILFPEGKIASDYISALKDANVPLTVQLKAKTPFESACYCQARATLQVLVDAADNLALRQCISIWEGIGPKTVKELRSIATSQGIFLWQAISNVATAPDRYRFILKRNNVREFYNWVSKLRTIINFEKIIPAILQMLPLCNNDAGIKILSDYLSGNHGKESIVTLAEILEKFEQEKEAGRFEAVDELPDRVRVMSFHSSKGLQAEVVFLPALEDDIIPGFSSNLEEKRRLFYVSITRAKRYLLLSWATQRTGQEIHRSGGKMLGKKPSQFLKEMGEA